MPPLHQLSDTSTQKCNAHFNIIASMKNARLSEEPRSEDTPFVQQISDWIRILPYK